MEKRILTPIVIEGIANVLGDTAEGLTGTEIHNILLQSRIEDVDPTNTKRVRLYNAFAKSHNDNKCSNNILKFIANALAPARFVGHKDRFDNLSANLLADKSLHSRIIKLNNLLLNWCRNNINGCSRFQNSRNALHVRR